MDDLENVFEKMKAAKEIVDDVSKDYFGFENFQRLQCACGYIGDALTLLRKQQPRVMTLAELWHMEHKPVYLERKNSRLYITEPSIVIKTERCYILSLGDSYILMRENKIHDEYWACDYNKTWRCWTSRPTDEQREDTPWDA